MTAAAVAHDHDLTTLSDADLLRELRFAEQNVVSNQMADTYGDRQRELEARWQGVADACRAELERRNVLRRPVPSAASSEFDALVAFDADVARAKADLWRLVDGMKGAAE